MNVFALDVSVEKCAQYHYDAHIEKSLYNYGRILSLVCKFRGIQCAGHEDIDVANPHVRWANRSLDNWLWLAGVSGHLNEEWKYRFDKKLNHPFYNIINALATPSLVSIGLTLFPQSVGAFQDKYPVKAYRRYYKHTKRHLANWTKRETPEWWEEV